MQRTVPYLKKHLWYTISLIFGIAIVAMAICYQRYMKFKYADFLLEKHYLMEEAVLDTMQKNLDYSLMEYIDLGARIAIKPEIYDLSEQVFFSAQEDSARDVRDLKKNLEILSGMSSNILNITVVTGDGETCQYDSLLRNYTMMWDESDAARLADIYGELSVQANSATVPRYLVKCIPSEHPVSGEKVFHMFYPLIGRNYSFSQMHTMLAITYKMELLRPFLEPLEDEASYSTRYITDDEGRIIYHANPDYIGRYESEYLAGSSLITLEKGLDRVGWTLHIALDRAKLNRSVDDILRQGMLAYCLLLMLLAIVFYMVMRKITKPLGKIKTAMNLTGNQGKGTKVLVEGSHEIWQVAQGYNEMLDKLEVQEQEVERQHQLRLISMERQHQAEWEALETQINAHFICNTLGTINYEAIEGGNVKVSLLIKKLSNILRYTFDQKRQTVYMSQEIAWIEQYLYLQKARLEDVFDYEIAFDEQFSGWPCCKLMLQPFVENAIIHGFEGREKGGKLYIKGRGEGGYLRLSITDNGCGIAAGKCAVLQQMLADEALETPADIGIGIRNVASRMRMFYGGKVTITLNSALGQGTEFIFMIPFPENSKRFAGQGEHACD